MLLFYLEKILWNGEFTTPKKGPILLIAKKALSKQDNLSYKSKLNCSERGLSSCKGDLQYCYKEIVKVKK